MKAIKLLLVAALFTGLTTLSVAGPGLSYWTQRTADAKTEKANQEKIKPQPTSDAPVQTCSHCGGCAGMQKS